MLLYRYFSVFSYNIQTACPSKVSWCGKCHITQCAYFETRHSFHCKFWRKTLRSSYIKQIGI